MLCWNHSCMLTFVILLDVILCLLFSVDIVVGDSSFEKHDSSNNNDNDRNDIRSPQSHFRASDIRRNSKQFPSSLQQGKAGLDVECTMRIIAYDMAMKVPTATKHSTTIIRIIKYDVRMSRLLLEYNNS